MNINVIHSAIRMNIKLSTLKINYSKEYGYIVYTHSKQNKYLTINTGNILVEMFDVSDFFWNSILNFELGNYRILNFLFDLVRF